MNLLHVVQHPAAADRELGVGDGSGGGATASVLDVGGQHLSGNRRAEDTYSVLCRALQLYSFLAL